MKQIQSKAYLLRWLQSSTEMPQMLFAYFSMLDKWFKKVYLVSISLTEITAIHYYLYD